MEEQQKFDIMVKTKSTIAPDEDGDESLTTVITAAGSYNADILTTIAASVAIDMAEAGMAAEGVEQSEDAYRRFMSLIRYKMDLIASDRLKELKEEAAKAAAEEGIGSPVA